MKFDVELILAANVALTKAVTFQVEGKTKGEAKRKVDELLDDLEMFINNPDLWSNRLERLLDDAYNFIKAYAVRYDDEESKDLACDIKRFLRHFRDCKEKGA